jgi:hypothetical protein
VTIPAIYAFYSVAQFFGFSRAMGIDHFDPAYLNTRLVKVGIVKWMREGDRPIPKARSRLKFVGFFCFESFQP